jgi:hypothetical protein
MLTRNGKSFSFVLAERDAAPSAIFSPHHLYSGFFALPVTTGQT